MWSFWPFCKNFKNNLNLFILASFIKRFRLVNVRETLAVAVAADAVDEVVIVVDQTMTEKYKVSTVKYLRLNLLKYIYV